MTCAPLRFSCGLDIQILREHTLLEALAKTISYTLRIGGSLREIASDLIGVSAYPAPRKGGAILSAADGMGKVFRDVEDGKYNAMLERGRAARGYAAERQPIAATEPPVADAPSAEGGDGWRECPERYGRAAMIEDCMTCVQCGWSKC